YDCLAASRAKNSGRPISVGMGAAVFIYYITSSIWSHTRRLIPEQLPMSLPIIFSNLRILASPVALAPGGFGALTQPRSPRIYRKIVAGTFGLLMVLA